MKYFELKNISYEVKILIIVILSILVPLIIFTTVSIYNSSEIMTQIIKKELKDKSVLVAYDIDKFIAGRITNTKVLSQADVLESGNIRKIIQYLTEIVEADEWIEDIDIISPSGEIIASSGEQNEKGLSIIQSQPEIKELFLLATKAQQGDVFVSNVQTLDTGHGIQFITPITDDTNTIVTNILAIEVNIKHITHIVSLFSHGILGNKYVYIVDNDGKIIVTDNPSIKLNDTFPDLNVKSTLLNAFSLQGSVGSVIYTDHVNDEVMAGYADMSEFGVNKGLDWSIIAIAPLKDITAPIQNMKWLLLVIGFIIAIISIIIAYTFTNKITIVLKNIALKADQISQGNYSQYLSEKIETKGAIGLLIIAFNRMVLNIIEVIDKLKKREQYLNEEIIKNKEKDLQLYEQAKMASMGEMIGNIAHQWRQPLSVISTGATGLQLQKEYDILTDEKFNETCEAINNNAQYLSKTIDDFKDFIKGDRKKNIFKLKDTINSFLNLVDGSVKSNDIHIMQNLQEDIKINGYENELIQCFINIFNNAKDALKNICDKSYSTSCHKDDRYIFISTKIKDDKVVINIKDNGGGIPDDILPHIFEPYFTTKHKSQGTGLGLHMTYNLIVDGMDGTIEANNVNYKYDGKEYVGAEFKITLPII